MDRVDFDVDVRAGFASVLDEVTKGICELWEVDEAKLKQFDTEELAKMPVGSEALFALLYSISAFLMETDTENSVSLLSEAAQGMEPAVLRHMGIQAIPISALLKSREDGEWN